MKLKSKTQIRPEVRQKVLDRDSFDGCPCCIVCGKALLYGAELHHYIERSRGGMGIEENLITLCTECHRKVHDNSKYQDYIREYLKNQYKDWSEEILIWSKF